MRKLLATLALALMLVAFAGISAAAQSPSPSPTPAAKEGTDLAGSLHRMTESAANFVPTFVREVEKPLGGYFELIAWWLAWLVFMVAFLKVLRAASDDPTELFWKCARAAVCFALLGWMADTNGDGIRGDLVNTMGSVGYTVAYGQLNEEGATGYLQKIVSRQQTIFNNNYREFVNNAFTVKVNNEDLPVKYPTDGSPFQRLTTLYSDGDDLKAVNEAFNPSGWTMSSLYQWLGGARTLVEFGDFFLLILQGFLVATLRLAAPFMIAVAIDPEWAKRVSIPFAWSAVVVTMVMPIISQIMRFIAYLAGNMAMDLASSDPYYKWDPTTLQIVAQGNPVWIVMIAAIIMTFFGLCMIGSPWVSYKLASGQVLEAATGLVTSWFGAGTSTALSAYSAAAGAALQKQAEQTQIQGTTAAETITTQSTRAAANTEARSRAAAEAVRSRATAEESSVNAIASAQAQNERAAAGFERADRSERAGFEEAKLNQEGKVTAEQNKSQVNMAKLPYDTTRDVPLIGPIIAGGVETGRNILSGTGATGTAGDVPGSRMPQMPAPGAFSGPTSTVGRVTGRESFNPAGGQNFSVERDGRAMMAAYQQEFGRPMPARTGQQGVHNREGYDHRNAMDVGVDPNTREGRWVRQYCQQNGIPYNAFDRKMWSTVTGKQVSTGPHVHVGKSSSGSGGQAWAIGTSLPTGNRPPLNYGAYQIQNRTGATFHEQTAMAPVDAAMIESNYSLTGSAYRASENIEGSRVETERVMAANEAEASTHVDAAWAADAQRQRAIGMELGGSLSANRIRYDGGMEAIHVRHEAMTSAARQHAVAAAYTGWLQAGASQIGSVFQQINRY